MEGREGGGRSAGTRTTGADPDCGDGCARVVKVLEMAGFDIIGDVHGCADELERLLDQLGYRIDPVTGAYRHGTRHALFVGDLVDRGPRSSGCSRS